MPGTHPQRASVAAAVTAALAPFVANLSFANDSPLTVPVPTVPS